MHLEDFQIQTDRLMETNLFVAVGKKQNNGMAMNVDIPGDGSVGWTVAPAPPQLEEWLQQMEGTRSEIFKKRYDTVQNPQTATPHAQDPDLNVTGTPLMRQRG